MVFGMLLTTVEWQLLAPDHHHIIEDTLQGLQTGG
jgi:hypothetical protein